MSARRPHHGSHNATLRADEWDEFRSRVDEDEGESALWVQFTVPA